MTAPSAIGKAWALRWSLAIAASMLVLLVGALSGALWYAEHEAERLITSEAAQAAESELDLLVQTDQQDGRADLLLAIRRRVDTEGRDRNKVYALRAGDGRILAGNLTAWPTAFGQNEEWRRVLVTLGGREIHAASRALPDGSVLLVGRGAEAVDLLKGRIIDAVWIAVCIVAFACLAIATAVVSLTIARVRRLTHVAEVFAAGDFAARAPGIGAGGPFDDIARAMNAVFDQVDNLITGLTTVTDSLAHDLRTPLARTRRVLERGALLDSPEEKQNAIDEALRETEQTISTFTSLIDIARAEGGLSRDAMEQVDLSAIAGDIYELFEPLAEERSVRFELKESAGVVVLGHRALLQQAISNLVHNAIKHCAGHVWLAVSTAGDMVDITVSDDGPGLSVSERQQVTKRFARGSNPSPEGVGLGLAIVEACAKLHRGTLILEDNHPGLRAIVRLPKH